MLIEKLKYYLGSRKDLIILAILNTLFFGSYHIIFSFYLIDNYFLIVPNYISMAKGNFNVIIMHAHRIAIP